MQKNDLNSKSQISINVKLGFIVVLVLFINLFIGQRANAQLISESEDELLKELASVSSDSAKARVYGKLSWEIRFIKSKEAKEYAIMELQYALPNKDYSKVAEAYRSLGINQVVNKNIAKAIEYYDSCIYYAGLGEDKFFQASGHSLKAGMYGDIGDYDKSIEQYTQGLEYAKQSGNNYILGVLSNNLADAYQYTNRNTLLVQENFKLAITASLKDKDYWSASLSSGNLAREYANQGQLDSMRRYMKIAESIFEHPDKKPYHRASVCDELANIYLILKQPAKAMPYAIMAEKILDSLQRLDNLPLPIGLQMKAYFDLKDYDNAGKTAERLLILAKSRDAKLYIKDAYKTLSDIAKLKGDHKSSLNYYEQYTFWKDSIFSISRDQSISNIELKSELAKKELETKLETQKKLSENKRLASQNTSLTTFSWLSSAVGLVLFGLSFLLWRAYKNKQSINTQLQKEKAIVEKQAKEKAMLIKEIHHRVKNNLTMLKSLLFLQGRATSNQETKRILEESQLRINSMALVHKKLYEDNDDGLINLKELLNNILNETAMSNSHSKIKIEADIAGHCRDLNLDIAIPLALMVNELITNSFKYAFNDVDTPLISINLNEESNKLKIVYSDNGKGLSQPFDLDNGGFGFKMLNLLSQQLDASISYQKQDGLSQFVLEL